MRSRRKETVGVGWQVDPRELGLEVKDRTDEGGVLVTEPVMLLPRPGGGLDVVETAAGLPPLRLTAHLDKLGVLHHHSLDDAQKRFIRGEETRTSSEGISLQHALTGVFGENLDHTAAVGCRGGIPLEVTTAGVEDGVKLVRYKLVGGEDTE